MINFLYRPSLDSFLTIFSYARIIQLTQNPKKCAILAYNLRNENLRNEIDSKFCQIVFNYTHFQLK